MFKVGDIVVRKKEYWRNLDHFKDFKRYKVLQVSKSGEILLASDTLRLDGFWKSDLFRLAEIKSNKPAWF